jgi:hypothetical protein
MTFLTATGYDVAAIMRDAHRRAKKVMAQHIEAKKTATAMKIAPYSDYFSFYLGQAWCLAQHEHRARLCTGATVTVAKAFDNGGSPLWRM